MKEEQLTRRLLLPLGSQLPPQEFPLKKASGHLLPTLWSSGIASSEAPKVGKEQVCTSETQPASVRGFSVRRFRAGQTSCFALASLVPSAASLLVHVFHFS